MTEKRSIAVDVMKFLAALAITNSHMGCMYTHFGSLATGGAIGDAIFFFCSGFTLFLGQKRRFDNWYKRRIRRIYPTVIMWGLVTAFLLNSTYTIKDCFLHGGGWFISCIMVYYIILFWLRVLFKNKLWLALGCSFLFSIIYYLCIDEHLEPNIYGGGTFKYILFFSYMLLGAIIGKKYHDINIKKPGLWLILSISLFYIMMIANKSSSSPIPYMANLLSLICLAGICITLYVCCNSGYVKKIYNGKFGDVIRFVGSLCLEIYVVQHAIINPSLNSIFPLNLVIIFLVILAAAYSLRCMARFFLQTFEKDDYNWKEIIRPY